FRSRLGRLCLQLLLPQTLQHRWNRSQPRSSDPQAAPSLSLLRSPKPYHHIPPSDNRYQPNTVTDTPSTTDPRQKPPCRRQRNQDRGSLLRGSNDGFASRLTPSAGAHCCWHPLPCRSTSFARVCCGGKQGLLRAGNAVHEAGQHQGEPASQGHPNQRAGSRLEPLPAAQR
ncbi:MAG: hypothetical protein RLZZ624_216, partial [Cyanobacteriota bacterium]